MKSVYNRSALLASISNVYADPQRIEAHLDDTTPMPKPLVDWLTDLALLHGVPFNYLVPDESMLPPESLRFFYLDNNWISALLDGAMSIGRNLTPQTDTPEMNLQRAMAPGVQARVQATIPQMRAQAFGLEAGPVELQLVSGFVLRSSLVLDYPSMGFNIYPLGHTPADPEPKLLEIIRLERLGPTSDTLIGLVAGDAYRVDVHESPQTLHYGIDEFRIDPETQQVFANKHLYTFGNTTTQKDGVTTNAITMSTTVQKTDISGCFRKRSPRVLGMDVLAQKILQVNKNSTPPPNTTAPTTIDSAAMGFEMTQGVGMVSFIKATS